MGGEVISLQAFISQHKQRQHSVETAGCGLPQALALAASGGNNSHAKNSFSAAVSAASIAECVWREEDWKHPPSRMTTAFTVDAANFSDK